MARPKVVICEGVEHTRAVIEEYPPGQLGIFMDASMRISKAGINIYVIPY